MLAGPQAPPLWPTRETASRMANNDSPACSFLGAQVSNLVINTPDEPVDVQLVIGPELRSDRSRRPMASFAFAEPIGARTGVPYPPAVAICGGIGNKDARGELDARDTTDPH